MTEGIMRRAESYIQRVQYLLDEAAVKDAILEKLCAAYGYGFDGSTTVTFASDHSATVTTDFVVKESPEKPIRGETA